MLLSILIPSLTTRAAELSALYGFLEGQIINQGIDAEILTDVDSGKLSVGKKRNRLIKAAKGEFTCFIDDDDSVVFDYVKTVREIFETGEYDSIGFHGMLKTDGKKEEEFIHSDMYSTWEKRGRFYVRPLNHLNPMRTEYFRKIKFPDLRHGEDKDFSVRLKESGLIKSEYYLNRIMYFYNFKSNKPIPEAA